MNRIYTIILFVISAIQGIAQCPTAFTVTGGGAVCTAAIITLNGSETGVTYQLKMGSTNVGSPIPGTGVTLKWNPAIPPNAGAYTIVGTNTSSACTQNMTGSAVYTFPNISIATPSGSTLTCNISPISLSGNSITPGATYNWTGPNGFNGNAALAYPIINPGTYTLTVSTPSGCVATRTRTIGQVLIPPVVTAAVSGVIPCQNQFVALQGNPTLFYTTYSWTGPGNFTSSLQNPSVNVPGVYNLTVTTAANCTGTASVTVNAATNSSLPVAFNVSGGGLICSNTTGTINLSNSQTGINYQLKLGSANYGTVVAGTGNPLSWNNLTTTGTYAVVATNATSSCSQTMNGASTITFVNLPTAFTISGGGTVCSSNITPLPLTLSGSQTGVNYQLISGSNNVGPAIPGTGSALNWPVTLDGIYTVFASTNAGCNQPMNGTATVSIYAFPITTITGPNQLGDEPITLSASSGSGYAYQWIRDEDDLSGKTDATLQVTTSGNYQAKIMANGCSTLSTPMYVSSLAKPNFNGLITATRWRTTKAFGVDGTDLQGIYTYAYDNKYQFKEAQWADPGNGFAFSNAYRVSNMDYDPNGNIKTLRRFDKDGIRTDNFSYVYEANKNKLASVAGYANAYTYNAIGQTISEDKVEENKDQYVEYNATGKVSKVFSDADKAPAHIKIEYLYDDRGFRLAKIDHVNNKTTWYIRDTSGRVVNIYEQDNLQNTIAQTEVPIYGAGKIATQYPQQDGFVNYEITDHLGNVRALVREESFNETATMESVSAEKERGKFLRYDNVKKINSYLFDHTNNAVADPYTTQGYAIRLRGGTMEKRGLAKSFAVAPGDAIHMEVFAKYLDTNSNNWSAALNTLVTQIATGTAGAGTVVDGANFAANGNSLLPFDGLLTVQEGPGPKAYLGWLLFDKNFIQIDGGYKRMSDVAKENGSDVPHEKLEHDMNITQAGYVYIYFSNDENMPVDVYFDDFNVTHTGSYISQATDYDIWGNVQREQRATLDTNYLYRYAYQGQFAEKDKETSWSHFIAREYDPVIARWTSIDPKRQFYSPYLGMGNNPISGFDPNGGDVILLSAPQGAGGFGHMAMLVGNNDTGWKFITKDGTVWLKGSFGAPKQSTLDAVDSKPFATVQDFLCSEFNNDKDHPGESEYHVGLRIETDEETDKKIISDAKQGALTLYHVLSENCMQNCIRPLVMNGQVPRGWGDLTLPNKGFLNALNFLTRGEPYNTELFQNYGGGTFSLIHENLPTMTIQPGELQSIPVNEEGWIGYKGPYQN